MESTRHALSTAATYFWPFRQREDVKKAEGKTKNLLITGIKSITHTVENAKKVWAKAKEFYNQHEKDFIHAGITLSVCLLVYCVFENGWYVLGGSIIESTFHARLLSTAEKLQKAWLVLPPEAKALTATVGGLGLYMLPFRADCAIVGGMVAAGVRTYFNKVADNP